MLEENEKCKLIQGDCLEKLKEIPNESIDLVLTDPPYNITNNEWDKLEETDFLLFTEEWLNECHRLSKGRILLSFWSQQKYDLINKINTKWEKRRTIIWYQPNAPLGSKDGLIFTWQPCFMFLKEYGKETIINSPRGLTNDVITCNFLARERCEHPTVKPLDVISKLINKFSSEGDTILDPFMGSGTTGICSLKFNRKFIGIEKNLEYFELAKKRINDWKNQTKLFEAKKEEGSEKSCLP